MSYITVLCLLAASLWRHGADALNCYTISSTTNGAAHGLIGVTVAYPASSNEYADFAVASATDATAQFLAGSWTSQSTTLAYCSFFVVLHIFDSDGSRFWHIMTPQSTYSAASLAVANTLQVIVANTQDQAIGRTATGTFAPVWLYQVTCNTDNCNLPTAAVLDGLWYGVPGGPADSTRPSVPLTSLPASAATGGTTGGTTPAPTTVSCASVPNRYTPQVGNPGLYVAYGRSVLDNDGSQVTVTTSADATTQVKAAASTVQASICTLLVTVSVFYGGVTSNFGSITWVISTPTVTATTVAGAIAELAHTAAASTAALQPLNLNTMVMNTLYTVACDTAGCNTLTDALLDGLWYGVPGGPALTAIPAAATTSLSTSSGSSGTGSATSSKSLSTGAIVGIVVGCVAGVVIAGAAALLYAKRAAMKRDKITMPVASSPQLQQVVVQPKT